MIHTAANANLEGVHRRRRFHLLVALLPCACGPESPPTYLGEYDVTNAQIVCRQDDPEAAVWYEHIYYVDPIAIEMDAEGKLTLPLPMPPCGITGTVEDDDLHLLAEDCALQLPATRDIEAQTVRYTNGRGLGIWNGDNLEITTETDRQFTSVPAGLPDWWDAPGSCSGAFTLVPHHLPDG